MVVRGGYSCTRTAIPCAAPRCGARETPAGSVRAARSAPGEFDLTLGGSLLQPQQAVTLCEQAVAHPDVTQAAEGDLQALQAQLMLDAGGAMAGMGKRVIEDRGLDLGRRAVARTVVWPV